MSSSSTETADSSPLKIQDESTTFRKCSSSTETASSSPMKIQDENLMFRQKIVHSSSTETAMSSPVKIQDINTITRYIAPSSPLKSMQSSGTLSAVGASEETLTASSPLDDQMETQTIEEDNISVEKERKIRGRKRLRYFGDIRSSDFESPVRRKKAFLISKSYVEKQRRTIDRLKKAKKRLGNKIASLKELATHLRQKLLISEDAETVLMTCTSKSSPILRRILTTKRKIKYSPEIRRFAITLSFYSRKAYNYVRDTFNKNLPHLSTISKWFQSINGKPGFCTEALNALKIKIQQASINNKKLVCNLVVDEMAIRKQVEFVENRYIGFIDFGGELEGDDLMEAKEVWVLMLVPLNDHWKIPLGYFLMAGLSGSERANLVCKCLEFIGDLDIIISSLTFDGAPVNYNMVTYLGGNVSDGSGKISFLNPANNTEIVVFPDPCHMLKLIRNCLGSQGKLIAPSGELIEWRYFEELAKIQDMEGLHLGNKLRNRHINWIKEKMNVKLAAQTFSKSVADALKFLSYNLKIEQFIGANATIEFCEIINNVFDILNTRNALSKNEYRIPLNRKNCNKIFMYLNKCITYFKNLKACSGALLIQSNRKTGFMGLIICIESLKKLYEKYIIEEPILNYILTYKLSQDHLELFFSAIRAKGGNNNNPTARQFEAAFKRLLVHSEIKGGENANVIALDATSILHTSSVITVTTTNMGENLYEDINNGDIDTLPPDHDYLVSKNWSLTLYVKEVIHYIAGFVLKKLKSYITCDICLESLIGDCKINNLVETKSRGYLHNCSQMLYNICEITERKIRYFKSVGQLFKKNIVVKLYLSIINNIYDDMFQQMGPHLMEEDALNTHITQLCKEIIKVYLKVRLHYEAKTRSDKCIDSRIRSQLTKQILFKNQ